MKRSFLVLARFFYSLASLLARVTQRLRAEVTLEYHFRSGEVTKEPLAFDPAWSEGERVPFKLEPFLLGGKYPEGVWEVRVILPVMRRIASHIMVTTKRYLLVEVADTKA